MHDTTGLDGTRREARRQLDGVCTAQLVVEPSALCIVGGAAMVGRACIGQSGTRGYKAATVECVGGTGSSIAAVGSRATQRGMTAVDCQRRQRTCVSRGGGFGEGISNRWGPHRWPTADGRDRECAGPAGQ
jgi:hypothetical protein